MNAMTQVNTAMRNVSELVKYGEIFRLWAFVISITMDSEELTTPITVSDIIGCYNEVIHKYGLSSDELQRSTVKSIGLLFSSGVGVIVKGGLSKEAIVSTGCYKIVIPSVDPKKWPHHCCTVFVSRKVP